VAAVELLEVAEGAGAEPAVQGRGGAGAEVVIVARGRGEAAAGARVRGEDAGHLTQRDGVGAEVQVERSGAPDVAPPGGEDLRAGAVLGGEAGDDVAEDGVGKVADAVHALPFPFFFSQSKPPLPLAPATTRIAYLECRPPAAGGGHRGIGTVTSGSSAVKTLFLVREGSERYWALLASADRPSPGEGGHFLGSAAAWLLNFYIFIVFNSSFSKNK